MNFLQFSLKRPQNLCKKLFIFLKTSQKILKNCIQIFLSGIHCQKINYQICQFLPNMSIWPKFDKLSEIRTFLSTNLTLAK